MEWLLCNQWHIIRSAEWIRDCCNYERSFKIWCYCWWQQQVDRWFRATCCRFMAQQSPLAHYRGQSSVQLELRLWSIQTECNEFTPLASSSFEPFSCRGVVPNFCKWLVGIHSRCHWLSGVSTVLRWRWVLLGGLLLPMPTVLRYICLLTNWMHILCAHAIPKHHTKHVRSHCRVQIMSGSELNSLARVTNNSAYLFHNLDLRGWADSLDWDSRSRAPILSLWVEVEQDAQSSQCGYSGSI